jgi:hypothetical protein
MVFKNNRYRFKDIHIELPVGSIDFFLPQSQNLSMSLKGSQHLIKFMTIYCRPEGFTGFLCRPLCELNAEMNGRITSMPFMYLIVILTLCSFSLSAIYLMHYFLLQVVLLAYT